MQEYLFNPITLICLGIMFILVSLLFFYFKRNMAVLEKAQMDQARVLQSFIANMEMSSMMHQRMPVNPGQVIPNIRVENDLIDVSDDDEDSDDEDSDDENESTIPEPEIIELSEQLEDSSSNVKVIQLEGDNLEEVTHLNIEDLDESSDDDDDDDDDDHSLSSRKCKKAPPRRRTARKSDYSAPKKSNS